MGIVSHVDVNYCVQKELSWSQDWHPEWQYLSRRKLSQSLLMIGFLLTNFMCALQTRSMVCFFNHPILTLNSFADPSVLIR